MILFLDLEINKRGRIFKIWWFFWNKEFKKFSYSNVTQFKTEILDKLPNDTFLIWHNILNFDRNFLPSLFKFRIIDTLLLSALFFPEKPYHRLTKEYKTNCIWICKNNPVKDSEETKKLLDDIIEQLKKYNKTWLKFLLSSEDKIIKNFVDYLIDYKNLKPFKNSIKEESKNILNNFLKNKVCSNVFNKFFPNNIEFLIACNFLYSVKDNSIPPKFLSYTNNFYKTLDFITHYRCENCEFCKTHSLNFYLKKYFNYNDFRKFGWKDLQKESVQKALNNNDILVIFPTWWWKSLTFQLPALIEAEKSRKMTIVISPLLSLMKDQVESLRKKWATNVGYINWLQNSLERAQTLRNIQEWWIDILYLAPESLRNQTIEKILSSRRISRFVIDEAHCFSKWWHDFRVDYLYLAEFIKKLNQDIKISCFTATAKKQVIEDIQTYFKERLNIDFDIIKAEIERNNLSYKKIDCGNENEKYKQLLKILNNEDPTIIFTNTTKKATELADKLSNEDLKVTYYHGQLSTEKKIKVQEKFMKGDTIIMVATNAFGMWVDKDNVRKIIHWEIPSSIENYLQEAGRAWRDGKKSECIVLYNEDDVNKVFNLQRQAEITKNEFRLLFNFFKKQKSNYIKVSYVKLAKEMWLEINKKSNWDTKVKVALSVLEEKIFENDENKFIKRKFTSNINIFKWWNKQNWLDEIEKLNNSEDEKYIMKKIYAEVVENNWIEIHYLEEIIYDEEIERISKKLWLKNYNNNIVDDLINKMIEKNILTTDKWYRVYYSTDLFSNPYKWLKLAEEILQFLIKNNNKEYEYKKLKDKLYNKKILNRKKDEELLFSLLYQYLVQDLLYLNIDDHTLFIEFSKSQIKKLQKTIRYAYLVLDFLKQIKNEKVDYIDFTDKGIVNFFKNNQNLIWDNEDIPIVQNILYFLHINKIIEVEDGLRWYNQIIGIEILWKDKKWKDSYYTYLKKHYVAKYEQAHILSDWIKQWKNYSICYWLPIWKLVKDYFDLAIKIFVEKYFENKKRILKRPISPKKWKEINEWLDKEQREILDVKKNTLIIAGPWAWKTKTLIHKIASLILKDGVKENEFLMLTFTNSAKLELKSRLVKFLWSSAYWLDIHTFHSYAYNILDRSIDSIKPENIIQEAVKTLNTSDESLKKRVIIIDEYQDITDEQFEFVKAIIENNIQKPLIIGAWDDDQNIYAFAWANLKYIQEFEKEFDGEIKYLTTNYRSCKKIVDFSQKWISFLKNRKKQDIELKSAKESKIWEIEILEIKKELQFNEIYPFSKYIFKADTAYLTFTNDRVNIFSAYLKKENIPRTILQKKKNFPFYELLEVRCLEKLLGEGNSLDDVIFNIYLDRIKKAFPDTIWLNEIKKAWEQFKKSNQNYYVSDFKNFIVDYELSNKWSFVSTLHKSKWKEFENVILDLHWIDKLNEETIHLIYVWITRAKKKLYIVWETKNPVYKKLKELFKTENYVNFYSTNNKIITINDFCIPLGLSDVNIGYNEEEKKHSEGLQLRNKIIYSWETKVQRLSRKFYEYLKKLQKDWWKIDDIEIYAKLYHKDFFVYLPKICFKR